MKKNILLIVLVFTIYISAFSQSKGYNYVDINTEALSVPMAYTNGNFLNAYNLTVLDLSHRLSDVFNLGEFNKPYELSECVTVEKVYYSKDNTRMLVLQPNFLEAHRRCVLLTNGNGESFTWSMTNLTAIDMALRGYVVAYFENAGNVAKRSDGNGTTVDYFTNKMINACNGLKYNTAREKFYTSMFANFFLSNAARKYMVDNSTKYAVDTTKFFPVGGSLGGNASLFYTYGDANKIQHPLFQCVKDKFGYDFPINQNGVVATGVMGGGLPGPEDGLGSILTKDAKRPAIMLCGAMDWVVNPNQTSILGPNNYGGLALQKIMDSLGIKNSVVVNAYGTHVFQTPSFNQDWTGLPNIRKNFTDAITPASVDAYVKGNTINLLMYQYQNTQMYEAAGLIASFFNNAVNNTLPATSLKYVQPKCLQNTIFYQYSIGKMSIKDAANCLTFNNCGNKVNKQLDKTTATCLDGTLEPYPKGQALVVPNNMNVIGKGMVKFLTVLEILNKLGGKK
jgi:hypothetical protein